MSKIWIANANRTHYYKMTELTKSSIGEEVTEINNHHALKGHALYRRYTYSEIKIMHNLKLL